MELRQQQLRLSANRFHVRRRFVAMVVMFNMIVGCIVVLVFSRQHIAEHDRRGLYDMSSTEVLPTYSALMTNVWDPIEVADQPFFWYIPKAGGLTFQKICAQCLDLVSASAKGIDTYKTDALTVYRLSSDRGLYLNVKPDSIDGIDRARRLDLVSSGMADIYISQLLAYSITSLFTSAHKARMIAMFRHPTKRIIDLFYYQQRATWEPNYDVDMASMSLEEFAASDKLIDNFMIRLLLDLSVTTVITFQHVTIAKELVRTKFVVGITEWYDQSIVRFEKYLGWWDAKDIMGNATVNACHYRLIQDGDQTGQHAYWNNADMPYQMITIRNWADVELYMYAKHLFAVQEELVTMGGNSTMSNNQTIFTSSTSQEHVAPSSRPSLASRVPLIVCNILRLFLGCGFYGCPC